MYTFSKIISQIFFVKFSSLIQISLIIMAIYQEFPSQFFSSLFYLAMYISQIYEYQTKPNCYFCKLLLVQGQCGQLTGTWGHGGTSNLLSQGDQRNLKLRQKLRMMNHQRETGHHPADLPETRRIVAEDVYEVNTANPEGRSTPRQPLL